MSCSHGDFNTGATLLAFYLCALHIANAAAIQGSNGLRMEVISKYSRDSPLSPRNLTDEQRYGLILKLSQNRVSRLTTLSKYDVNNRAATNGTVPDLVTPPVTLRADSTYAVGFAIGTPGDNFFLELDTGNPLTWIQCAGCHECIYINFGSFDYTKSQTYKPVSCHDRSNCIAGICTAEQGKRDLCQYSMQYVDESRTQGILSVDNMLIYSEGQGDQLVTDVMFGCGFYNKVNFGHEGGATNGMAGIFGMGRGPRSSANQLGEAAQGRFSFCLNHWRIDTYSYLRFGEDAYHFPSDSIVQSTPLMHGPLLASYYVNLLDISVDGYQLRLPPDTFKVKPDRTGGMILDTGGGPAVLVKSAYDRLEERVRKYFSDFPLTPFDPLKAHSWPWLRLCYVRPAEFYHFPAITFHLEGADFTPEPGAAFIIFDRFFCLQILPSGGNLSFIGSFIMSEHYFLHDTWRGRLYFAKADCRAQK